MQLISDTGDIDRAIAENDQLIRPMLIEALAGIIRERKRQHRPLGDLRRRLQLLRARQLVAEAQVD